MERRPGKKKKKKKKNEDEKREGEKERKKEKGKKNSKERLVDEKLGQRSLIFTTEFIDRHDTITCH